MRPKLENIWERWFPCALAAIHFAITLFITIFTDFRLSRLGFDASALWPAVFSIAAGATGILFSVFVFSMAPAAGFVEKIQALEIFSRFVGFVKAALFLTVLTSFAVLPLLAATSTSRSTDWYTIWSIFTSSLMVAALLSVFRVVRIFFIWASAD